MGELEHLREMSIDDYLALEEQSMGKHEYLHGQIFAMSGATQAHNLISMNLGAALHGCLRGSGCRVFQSDMKVRVEAANSFYYPDIVVTCEPFDAGSVFIKSPVLIAEVLSPSTRQIDRREKLVAYRQLDSLRQYILVSQNRVLIEVYTRITGDHWERSRLHSVDDLHLQGLTGKLLSIPVSAVYEGVVFEPSVQEAEEEYELV